LNQAKNYDEYRKAISTFTCPGQNFIFASKQGDIAITQQGRFPLKWEGQGQFVLDGSNPLHTWQAYIPFEQNPTDKNPERGFLFSSNQHATDSDYPYPIYGYYDYTRNLRISSALKGMNGITVQDMFKLQNDNFNEFAAILLPKVLPMIAAADLNEGEKAKLKLLQDWNLMNDYDQVAPSVFQAFSDQLYSMIWDDDLARYPHKGVRPERFLTFEWLADSLPLPQVDDIATNEVEDLAMLVKKAFKAAMVDISEFETKEKQPATWQNFNNVHVLHLSRQAAFSYFKLPVGGNAGVVNANRGNTGASWRMVVEMGDEIDAYAIFPGGQSGNPGSPYYGKSIADWAAGRYHKVHFLKPGQTEGPALAFTHTFQPN
jgi:penicillin amidase